MKRISLIFAMEQEAAGLIKALDLKAVASPEPRLPFRDFAGSALGLDLTVTLLGRDPRFDADIIGTEPAAVAAFATIQTWSPALLISAGTCGSFAEKGAHIGRVYLSDNAFYYHDHRIPLPQWQRMGRGEFASFDAQTIAERTGLTRANVSSGNSLDYVAEDLAAMRASGAILKEMEAGGIAWVAQMMKVPLLAIKSVTNLIDTHPDSPAEFQKNFSVAVEQLTLKTLEVLRVFGSTIETLD